MPTLVLSHHDVTELLTFPECIDVMRAAFIDLARGEVHQPLRSLMRPPGASGFLGLMPAYRAGNDAAFGLKVVCVMPENPKRGLDTHVGVVILASADTGEPLAIANAAAITSIRTAAVTALATDLLARRDAKVLAIVGTGAQANAHIAALRCVREFETIKVAGRTAERARQFADSLPSVTASSSIEEAVHDADVVVTVTNSRVPVIRRAWIRAGTHLNAVGSSVKSARELDSDTVSAASLFVDWRESTLNESGDVLDPIAEGRFDESHIRATIGDLLINAHPGRSDESEITLFKSLGLAIEDLAALSFLHTKAVSLGRGATVEI